MKNKRKTGFADDMAVLFLLTYAFAAFSYEKYMPEEIMKIYNLLVFLVFAAVWLGVSFRNGKRMSRKFPVFAMLFWILPQIIIYLADNGPEVMRMSIIMYVLSEFCILLTSVPADIIGGALDIPTAAAIAVILLLCAAAYMFGVFVRVLKKGNYTPLKTG